MGYWETFYHLVWATKDRLPVIDASRQTIIDRSFRHTCREGGAVVHAVGIMPDHVHLAISIPPRWSVSNLVRDLKISATHAVNRDPNAVFRGTFAWQPEFGVFTFDASRLEYVVAYVLNQREHHAATTIRPRLEQSDRDGAPL